MRSTRLRCSSLVLLGLVVAVPMAREPLAHAATFSDPPHGIVRIFPNNPVAAENRAAAREAFLQAQQDLMSEASSPQAHSAFIVAGQAYLTSLAGAFSNLIASVTAALETTPALAKSEANRSAYLDRMSMIEAAVLIIPAEIANAKDLTGLRATRTKLRDELQSFHILLQEVRAKVRTN